MDDVKTCTLREIQEQMASLRKQYSLVRLVDPEECRELTVGDDGTLHFGKSCFGIWNGNARCANCISYRACHMRKTLSKVREQGSELVEVTSVPFRLRDDARNSYIVCSLELGKPRSIQENPDLVYQTDRNDTDFLLDHDTLTQLFNTEGFYRAAREEIMKNPGLSYVIMVANIRKFKILNALYGRSYGDSILVSIAEDLRASGRPHSLFGYDSSDGFLVLMPEITDPADWLQTRMSAAEQRYSTSNFLFSMSAGLYEIKDPDLPMSLMTGRAVLAMRSVGASQENTIAFFDDKMLQRELHEQKVVGSFDDTLAEGRFRMYLQPQVDAEGRFIGAEALVRAFRKDGTLIPPVSFIGILEDSDQIARLDRFIWESAAAKLAEWSGKDSLKDAYISVNVSPRDLYLTDVPETFRQLCEQYGIEPSRLHVEITETSVLDDIKKRAKTIERLQSYGFLVEIDDFGKGSSSLSMLSQSSADVLKIDKEFIDRIQTSDKSFRILSSVIGLTKEIGMHAIVEGVETKEQLDILKSIGCDTFQGFYFARPMPAQDVEERYGREFL